MSDEQDDPKGADSKLSRWTALVKATGSPLKLFALMVLVYAVINIAMVTGVAPVVGVPLPLVSYGGTNMMSLMAAMGLAMSAHVHGRERL